MAQESCWRSEEEGDGDVQEETSPPSISKQENPAAVSIQSLVFLSGTKLRDNSKQKSPNVNIAGWEGPRSFGKPKSFCHFEKEETRLHYLESSAHPVFVLILALGPHGGVHGHRLGFMTSAWMEWSGWTGCFSGTPRVVVISGRSWLILTSSFI